MENTLMLGGIRGMRRRGRQRTRWLGGIIDLMDMSLRKLQTLVTQAVRICLQCRRPRFDPWLGRPLKKGMAYPLQYSRLENSMDRGAWQATVHGVAKSRTPLSA